MPGDRGLAFVMIGLMAATVLWAGKDRIAPHRAKPVAYAAVQEPDLQSKLPVIPAVAWPTSLK